MTLVFFCSAPSLPCTCILELIQVPGAEPPSCIEWCEILGLSWLVLSTASGSGTHSDDGFLDCIIYLINPTTTYVNILPLLVPGMWSMSLLPLVGQVMFWFTSSQCPCQPEVELKALTMNEVNS